MQIKKFLATGLSAVMAGATLATGALAAQPLSDYPDFLGKVVGNTGQVDALVVVGADAQPADIVGAGDVVAGLASLSYVMTTGGGGTVVSGGDREDIDLGTALNATDAFGATVEDQDVDGFFDGEISISIGGSSETYDVHDELRLGSGTTGSVKLQTGLTAANPDEDFGSNIFLEALVGSIEYRYVFDETIKAGNFFNDSTDDDPIIFDFMGRQLRITDADSDSITVDVGERFTLKAGESATTSDGKTVTLEKAVSTSKAQVIIDGQSDIIDEDSVRTIGGTEVKVEDVADDDGIEFDSAVVIVGTAATDNQATDTFDSGEEYIIPCGTLWHSDDCDADNADWVWNLASLNTGTPTIGVKLDESIDTPEDEPPTLGNDENHVLDLPGGFAWISLDSATTDTYQAYELRDQTKDLLQGSGASLAASAHVLEISGEGDDDAFTISVNGTNKDTDNIYLYINHTANTNDSLAIFFEDNDDGNKIKFVTQLRNTTGAGILGLVATADLATMEFEGSSVQLNVTFYVGDAANGGDSNVTIAVEPDANSAVPPKYLAFYVEEDSSNDGQINYVGDSDSDTTTARDVVYGTGGTAGAHTSGGTDISGWDADTRTAEGIIVKNPDSNSPSDRYKIEVPSESGSNDFQVAVTIGSSGTTTTPGTGGKQLVPITSSITKLDTEITTSDRTSKHMVLVGGPAVNRLTAEAMGIDTYPAYGAASGIPENAALISVIEDALATGRIAVVVAGWEADDTRLATSVLQQAATKLAGVSASSVTVTGTSVASAVITPA